MANTYNFGGSVAQTGNFSGDPGDFAYRDYSMVTGTIAANGNAPIRIESVSAGYLSGSGHAGLVYQGVATSGGSTFGSSGGTFQFRIYRDAGTIYIGTNNANGGSWNWYTGGGGSGTIPGSLTWSTVPTAPTIGTVTQTSPVSATLTWSAPGSDGGSAITGYRILYATNSAFTGATTLDVDNVLTRSVTGLTPGAQVWFKVAALNAPASGASTSSVFSSAVNVVLVADIGDLDGWASYGTLPSGLTPIVTGALRRGSVYPVAGKTGLLREVQQTGTGGPVTTQTLGIQRMMTGLKIGTNYKLTGTMVSLQDTTPTGNEYAFFVAGTGTGTSAATSNTATQVTIPDYSFTAFDTSQVMGITLKETTSWSGSGWWEAVGFFDLKLYEVPPTSPYKLQDVAYEGPLSSHFSYACDTVGAAWWVDRSDTTQFRQADSQDALKAIFTDRRAVGKREYTNVNASYATRDVVNTVKVTNHGRDATTGKVLDYDYTTADPTSVTAWGVRAGSTDWTLYTPNMLTNMIANPSRETNTTGYFANAGVTVTRQLHSSFGGGIPDIATESAYFIRHTYGSTQNASGPYYNVGVTIVPGKTYTWSAWVRCSKVQGFTPAIQYATGSGPANPIGDRVILAANVWTRVSFTFTAGGTWTNAAPYFYSAAGTSYSAWASGDTVDIDGLIMVEGTTAPSYFDGASADDTYWDYSWSGTAHASTSTKSSLNVQARTAEVLAKYSTPVKTISSLRWNAQEDPALAASLDIQDRVRVEFQGQTQDSRIVGIKHELTGDRWMIQLELVKST